MDITIRVAMSVREILLKIVIFTLLFANYIGKYRSGLNKLFWEIPMNPPDTTFTKKLEIFAKTLDNGFKIWYNKGTVGRIEERSRNDEV